MEDQKKAYEKKSLSWIKNTAVIVAIITGIFLLLNTVVNKYLPAYKPPAPPKVVATPINLITDGGFDNGIIGCTNTTWNIGLKNWCTNDTKNIVIDKNTNGNGATPVTSAKLVSNTINSQNTY